MDDIPEAAEGPVDLEALSLRDLMVMVLSGQRVTHQLVEALVRLMVPQDGPSEGPTLEQMLTALLGQNRRLIGAVQTVLDTLVLHETIIPANTVEALRVATAGDAR